MNIDNIDLLLEGLGYNKIGLNEFEFQGENVSRISITLSILKDKVFQLKLSKMTPEERAKEMEIMVNFK